MTISSTAPRDALDVLAQSLRIERVGDLDRMWGWASELRKENASLKAVNGSLQKTVAKLAGGIERERMACAFVVLHACLEPPDGGCPSESERLLCERIAAAIRARSGTEGEKKEGA